MRPAPGGPGRLRLGLPGGQGTPLLLLPGIEGDARVWSRCEGLAADRPTQAWDLPPGDTIEAMADALLAQVEGPVLLMGASLGGLVARAAAARAPGQVRALVALGTLPHPRHRRPGLGLAARALSLGPPGPVAARYRARIRARHAEEGVPDELSAQLLAGLPPPDLLACRLRAVAAWRAPAPPHLPTLWLRGQVDHEAPWTTAQAAVDLPGAAVQTVPGGHRAMLTHPQALVAVVAHFLRGVDRA